MPVTGLTCASCVRRVEKALGKVEGVEGASVNLATEKARVSFDPEVADARGMVAAIEKAGYGVREMPAPASAPPTDMPSGTPPRPADGGAGGGEVLLAVEGMTCASCVGRVEKALLRVPGVEAASVNLATEKAKVSLDPTERPGIDELKTAVE